MADNQLTEETRALILDKAQALFAQFGYAKTTIADIARECGFSSAKVHKYLGTKSVIKKAIAEINLRAIITAIEHAVEAEHSASGKLGTMIRMLHDLTLEGFRRKAKMFEMIMVASEEKWDVVRDYRLSILGLIKRILEEGRAAGEFQFEDLERTALAVHMCCVRLSHPFNVVEMIDEPDRGDTDLFVDFVLRGLTNKSTTA